MAIMYVYVHTVYIQCTYVSKVPQTVYTVYIYIYGLKAGSMVCVHAFVLCPGLLALWKDLKFE